MQSINESSKDYFKNLDERSKKSRIYHDYQMTGLQLAEILNDLKHKALYIKLAKQHPVEKLFQLAKTVAENPNVQNRGAYFMHLLHKK